MAHIAHRRSAAAGAVLTTAMAPLISPPPLPGHDSVSTLGRVGAVFRKTSDRISETGLIRKLEDAMAEVVSAPVENTVRVPVRGRPSLGQREQVTAALWPSLEAVITDARGSIDRSPFLADLLAWHVGRPDVIRHTQLALAFSTDAAVVDAPRPSGPKATRHITVRVHPDVARELDRGARQSGLPRGVFIAEAIAESLGVRPTRTTAEDARLPLAM